MLTSLGVSNVSFGFGRAARAVLNSVFLHHCVEAGLDLAMVHPADITPYGEIPQARARARRRPRLQPREDATQRFIEHFEEKGEAAEEEAADPTAGMEPEEALHFHILRRKKDGVEDWIDRSVEKIGAVPTLNDVLLPAMKEVGDKFGAGELILPFVLQSAEVMKKAVARLENYLDRIEGYTKGTVVLATVFGDVHDIGKSLVNTILTNNGYTVVDLGKQVPISTILDAAQEHRRDRDRPLRAARLDLEADAAVRAGAARARAAVPGADRRRGDQPRLRPAHPLPARQRGRRRLRARRLLLQGRVRGPREDGPARRRGGARGARREDARRRADAAREAGRRGRRPADDRRLRALRRAHRHARADAAVLGRARGRGAARRGLPAPRHARAVQAPLGRARREGRGLARAGAARTSSRAWSACGREQTYLHPRAKLGYFPCRSEGNEVVVFDPEDHEQRDRPARLPAPAAARPHLPRRLLPPARQRRDATSSPSRSSPPATRSPS